MIWKIARVNKGEDEDQGHKESKTQDVLRRRERKSIAIHAMSLEPKDKGRVLHRSRGGRMYFVEEVNPRDEPRVHGGSRKEDELRRRSRARSKKAEGGCTSSKKNGKLSVMTLECTVGEEGEDISNVDK